MVNRSYTTQVPPSPAGNTVLLLGMGKVKPSEQTSSKTDILQPSFAVMRSINEVPGGAAQPSPAGAASQPWGPLRAQGPPYLLSVLGQRWQGHRDVLLAGPDHGLQRQLLHLRGPH